MTDQNERTPPQIVAASDDPMAALAAFIGQELEHWGFDVRTISDRGLSVVLNGDVFDHPHLGVSVSDIRL
jgi:hypothetical protein